MSGPAGPSVPRTGASRLTIAIAVLLFLALAPLAADTYNTICHRGFLDLIPKGNPYALARHVQLSYGSITWPFDFAYPPLTILFLLPGWLVYRLTHSEAAYQVAFKLTPFVAAVSTQILLIRMARDSRSSRQPFPASWYVLLPGVFLATTVAGALDVVGALLILLTVYAYGRGRRATSALSLGIAGALRLFPFAVVPVYLIHLWRDSQRRWRDCTYHALLSFTPLVLTCTPFFVTDAGSFLGFLGGQQTQFGPFSSLFGAAATFNRHLLGPLGYSLDPRTLGYFFVALTGLGLAAVYAWIATHPAPLARDSLLALLTFFLLYPKGQGLYITALVPLALIEPIGLAALTWVPGTLWMLLVNGTFGASGLAYWFAPLTGVWRTAVPRPWFSMLTIGLGAAQALLIFVALTQITVCAHRPAEHPSSPTRQLARSAIADEVEGC